MEAMAAGRPVVASDIPPNRELVLPGETGFLFKLADSVGIMQFLRRLIDEPGLSERLGRAGRERIEREFSIERMVDSYAELYRELATSGAGSQPSPPRAHASLPRAERLAEFYRRLATELTATSADEALHQVSEVLDTVEDELSGIPRQSPPPRQAVAGARMYPPLDDRIIRYEDGSLSARTRGHRIEIEASGSVTIFNRRTGTQEFP
jgi:glycosyl transferase family 1